MARLKTLFYLASKGLMDLYFGDESGFSLTPYVPYGWSAVGQQSRIDTQRKHVSNIFGLLNPFSDHVVSYPTDKEQTINSDYMITCLDNFAGKLHRETVICLDNAPWHTSEKFIKQIPIWEEKGMYIFYMPKYCPHLNLIETLWRKIKYEWLRPKDYHSKTALQKRLKEIFTSFGEQFSINFSMNIYT